MKDMAKLGLTLMIICAVAGLGLALVYEKTKPVIEAAAQQDLLTAAQEVIPGATSVKEELEDDKPYFVGYSGSEVVGSAVKMSSRGYGQTPMELIVGFDTQGVVTKVVVLSTSETPGIGTRVNSQSYLSKYEGVEDPSTVDGISGASYSSRAVQSGVSSAQEFIQQVFGLGEQEVPIVFANTPDGTYKGTGEGLFGPITVSVEISGGELISVSVTETSETPDIAGPVFRSLPKDMIERQIVDVDTVSGATFSSKGLIEAVKAALRPVQPAPGALDLSSIPDGAYPGTGKGLFGDISVSVEMKDGKIDSVKITAESETPDIAKPAFKGIPNAMVEQQKLDVDTISGATFTSKGIIEAVKNALAGAVK